ncbi:MAG: GWxTD domain-containing protein [Chitinophagaceae bacterium]|nr:GWxTD domain-containing protein [Chitinophagaceae bacterium]
MSLRIVLICLGMLGCYSPALAIRATTTSSVFYKKTGNNYAANIVLNWRAQSNTIHFNKNTRGDFEALFVCTIRFSNASGIYKEESFKMVTPGKPTLPDALAQSITDQYTYTLPPDHYSVQIALYEPSHTDQAYEYKDTLTIHPAPANDPFLSGVQLLDTFFESSTASLFTRNGFLDLPLNSNYLDEHRDRLFFYYEAYDATRTKEGNRPLKITTYLSWKPFGSPVPGKEKKDSLIQQASFQAFHGSFDLQNVYSGNYYLNIVLSDKYDMVLDKKSVFLQRFSTRTRPKQLAAEEDTIDKNAEPGKALHVLDLTTTFVGKYTASQVRAILKMMLLVADPTEGASIEAFLRKPDELYSKYFIYNFWEKRNKQNPEQPWKAFTAQIKEVNRLFGDGGKPGYETDRGRIYMQYGKPSDRIIVNSETGALPYEIWQYFITEKQQREGIFLFYKAGRTFGGYELLHSTVVGEKRNSNWRNLLYNNSITGSGEVNNNSQAEQYIGNK